jgi:aspartate dehydrogenase
VAITDSIGELLAAGPSVVVEAAGHSAVRDCGAPVLRTGADLYVLSAGSLVDEGLAAALRSAAEASGASLLIPAGAVAGLDGLLALRASGLESVSFTSTKPPRAWRGTEAERRHDLEAIAVPTVIFEGSAREAAGRYPKNANLAATIAFAGLGLDLTHVRLIADPAAAGNSSQIEARSSTTIMSLTMKNVQIDGNPKTSAITGFSVIAALQNRSSVFKFN